ncbi:MAG: Ig-like domain-containing protein [Candidatus Electronema aureum]|uniref:Ig-like domain-containing protein n=1 Tax=Candidatus Electronema aureum TaxID=2005002 RepID=A0A521FYX4_9BACT|nr:MAG: Ig-like domain-containing protein [Candidatus Electronema aureum]
MDNEFIKIIGPAAGLGGIALAVFLSLFHSFIRKLKPVSLTQDQWFRITRLFLILTWAIGALGIIAWAFASQNDKGETKKELRAYEAKFINDINYPDGSAVMTKETFIKRWSVQNIGSAAWDNLYIQRIGVSDGEGLLKSENIGKLPYVSPNDMAEISVKLHAPSRGGRTIAYWKMVSKKDDFVLKKQNPIFVELLVKDNSSFVEDENCPNGSIFRTNDEFKKKWVIKNITNKKWVNIFLKKETGGLLDSVNLMPIPDIPSGESREIELKIMTPSDPTTTTTYWTIIDNKGNNLLPGSSNIYMTAIIVYRPEEIFGGYYERCDMK